MGDAGLFPVLLIADDNDEDFFLAKEALAKCGVRHRLKRVCDGQELMDYLLRQNAYADPGRSPRPALILLDLSMPGRDGFDLLSAIKTDPALRRIPVIVFSSCGLEEVVQRSYELGCNAFVQKPNGLALLVQALEGVTRLFLSLAALPVE